MKKKIDYSKITKKQCERTRKMEKCIDRLIAKYKLGKLQSVFKPDKGMMTENVIINIEKRLFFIQQRSEWLNDSASIQAHYELTDFLVKNGFLTPRLITKEPENIDNACFDIYKGIEAGRLLGQFHRIEKYTALQQTIRLIRRKTKYERL